nr:unnamed protein product [Callosobruchus chinensis]
MVNLYGISVTWTMESMLEFTICLGFLYWAFPDLFSEGFLRVNKMVDVVTTRVFDTYNRYSPLNNNHNESLASLSTLKRFSKDQSLKKVLSREADQKARDAQLFDIKENHPDVQLSRKRPFMGLSCQNCLLTSRVSSNSI